MESREQEVSIRRLRRWAQIDLARSCSLHSPATSYQLPATSYQLPATSYQLPATSYQPFHPVWSWPLGFNCR
ncbi:hypothetical protein [Desulfurispira natronophila]|nr:hypothetical protein [Desulfurispira natronophila]